MHDIDTHPFTVRWSHPTGERLTRQTNTVEVFATEAEAIAALVKPFGANTTRAVVIKHTGIGQGLIVAKRANGKKMVRVAR